MSPGSTSPRRNRRSGPEQEVARRSLSPKAATDRPWSAGDNVQLAIGQGDLQTNPLQMAIAYAALANDGTIVTPHVGMEVEDAAGRVLKEFDPKPRRRVEDRPRLPGGDPRGPARSGAGAGRHLLRRLRRLPDRCRRQDRHGGTARSRRPVLVRGRGSVSGPAHRHDRHRRGRRLRRRSGGAGGAADPRSLFRQAGRAKPAPPTGAAPDDVRQPHQEGAAASRSRSGSASASASASPTWTGR